MGIVISTPAPGYQYDYERYRYLEDSRAPGDDEYYRRTYGMNPTLTFPYPHLTFPLNAARPLSFVEAQREKLV